MIVAHDATNEGHDQNLVERGADVATVRDLMGHSSLSVTSRYVHGVPEAAARAVRGLSVGRKLRVRLGQADQPKRRFLA